MESLSLSDMDFHTARALLEWQVEFGVTETMLDAPVNRFEIAQDAARAKPSAAAPAAEPPKRGPVPLAQSAGPDAVAMAQRAANAAGDLAALRVGLAGFEACELKRGARNLVFADGTPGAPVMVIGEAPGREEDRAGRPFVGPSGELLDNMLAAIDLRRDENVYITNVLPWRLPHNSDPKPDDIAMMLPFLQRHVALAQPRMLVLMGNIACQAVLARRGVTRLRGHWSEAMGLPVLPMFHPAYLLRNPEKKREAWADLLTLKERLRG